MLKIILEQIYSLFQENRLSVMLTVMLTACSFFTEEKKGNLGLFVNKGCSIWQKINRYHDDAKLKVEEFNPTKTLP